MSRKKIARIIASNPAFANVDIDTALANYEDSKRERNATMLPEFTVTATKPKPKEITYKDIDPSKYSYSDIVQANVESNPINRTLNYGARNFEHTFGVSPREVASFIPFIGDVLDINDISTNLYNKNYNEATLGAGFLLLPNIVEKPLRNAIKWIPLSDFAKKLIKRWETEKDPNKVKYFEAILDKIALLEGRIEAINYTKNFDPNAKFPKGTPKLVRKKEISAKGTNSPNGNNANVGGTYNPRNNTVYLREPSNQSASFHEHLHAFKYGQNSENEKLISEIIDPELTKNMSEKSKLYFLSTYEMPVHFAQRGRDWRLTYGQSYPGDNSFLDLKFKFGIGGAPYYAKLKSSEDYKRFWDALTGKYFKL